MDRIFLLGGHDLEMLEIRRLLERVDVRYADAALGWGNANLSAYTELMQAEPDGDYYGVELHEDCMPPQHYTRIDHHNDCTSRPAAILQVAALLSVEPDRRMMLVAANDARYIPGMLAMGASEDEVRAVRRADRAAQGVTEEDERLAEQSIAEGVCEVGDGLIVHALTGCFSPICDRLYPYHRLLVYTDREWTFYGEGAARLCRLLQGDVDAGRIYYGGGTDGYAGAVAGTYTPQEIEDFVEKYKTLTF